MNLTGNEGWSSPTMQRFSFRGRGEAVHGAGRGELLLGKKSWPMTRFVVLFVSLEKKAMVKKEEEGEEE